jgi:hypothetical protein
LHAGNLQWRCGCGAWSRRLGASGSFAILSKSGISTVPLSTISTFRLFSCLTAADPSFMTSAGDIGVSPGAATSITGFSLTLDPGRTFSLSAQVIGRVFAANYAPPTPVQLTTAVANMGTAYTNSGPTVLAPPNFTPTSVEWAFSLPFAVKLTCASRPWATLVGSLSLGASTSIRAQLIFQLPLPSLAARSTVRRISLTASRIN